MTAYQGALDAIHLWALFAATIMLIMGAVVIGYRVGMYRLSNALEKAAPVSAMAAAMLGLLAFMLAFTFGLAAVGHFQSLTSVRHEASAMVPVPFMS